MTADLLLVNADLKDRVFFLETILNDLFIEGKAGAYVNGHIKYREYLEKLNGGPINANSGPE